MATIYTHAVVGLGIAQLYWPGRRRWLYFLLAALLAIVPDFDTFSTATYGAALGHRGFTHSLLFALWLGLFVASLTYRYLHGSFWALFVVFSVTTASHGVLDAMTRGGMPIPFFWPLSNERSGDWGPIPLSDLAFEFPNPGRSRALRSELVWIWLPTALLIAGMSAWRWYHPKGSRQPELNQRHP